MANIIAAKRNFSYFWLLDVPVIDGDRKAMAFISLKDFLAGMGIGTVDDKRVAVTVPSDAIIEVTGGPRPNDRRMVDVRWDGRRRGRRSN